MDPVDTIIFSKDRACQLDALLRSIHDHAESRLEGGRWLVIYTCSDDSFSRAYDRLRETDCARGFEFLDQRAEKRSFKEIVMATMEQDLARDAWRMFLVDDDVIKTDWPEGGPMELLGRDAELACVSLRMCPRFDYSYTLDKPLARPRFDRQRRWKWRKAAGDWGYPMSLDGHVFRAPELFELARGLEFANPNSFEAALARKPLSHRPRMVCYDEAILVNLPLNLVQSQWRNRHAEHGPDAATLNQAYLEGRRIDLAPIYALRDNRAPHHEMAIGFEE